MSIGDMRHEVVLQERISTPDGMGGTEGVWRDVAENPRIFAAAAVLSAAERLRFRQLEARATHRFFMRYRADVKAGMRVLWDERVYRVFSVSDPDARRRFLEVLGEEM